MNPCDHPTVGEARSIAALSVTPWASLALGLKPEKRNKAEQPAAENVAAPPSVSRGGRIRDGSSKPLLHSCLIRHDVSLKKTIHRDHLRR